MVSTLYMQSRGAGLAVMRRLPPGNCGVECIIVYYTEGDCLVGFVGPMA